MSSFRRTASFWTCRPHTAAAALVTCAFLYGGGSAQAAKPTDAGVLSAISRATAFLKRAAFNHDGAHADLAALAVLKSGADAEDPFFAEIIEKKLLPKFIEGKYRPSWARVGNYEAGVDLMLISNLHRENYHKERAVLADVLLEKQSSTGYWDYPVPPLEHGDTSITQYALLGLWDAQRAGMQIPSSVWDRAAGWLLSTQMPDGGFVYHPGTESNDETMSMTAAGTSNLLVCRLMLFGESSVPSARKQSQSRFGVLKKIDLDPQVQSAGKRPKVNGPIRSGRGTIESAARRGIGWLNVNWTNPKPLPYRYYYYYALERACALAGTDKVGDHDWYDEISDHILTEQRTDGSWDDGSQAHPIGNTAFAILFLSRATAKSLGHSEVAKLFGGGLMIGGRGLPTNLAAVQTGAEGIKVRKLEAPVDQLLSELENPKSTRVEAAQQAIIETVQVGDREKLIGQKDRLRRLTHDARPEVRRTAIWALGRCATIHDALVFIKALDDIDFGVALEANGALCWLSRRPNGLGHSNDPLADLTENTPEARKLEVARAWRAEVRADWRAWFDKVRPYSEQDLPIDLP